MSEQHYVSDSGTTPGLKRTCAHTSGSQDTSVATSTRKCPTYTHKPWPERVTPSSTPLPADTGDRPGKLQGHTDASSHAHEPLPDRPAQKTPTNHQIPQPTATCLVNTCKPAKTLLGHTPHPTCMNKHWTQHTQQQTQGHTSPPSKHTDHRQNQTHPGEGDINNTGPPETATDA